MRKILLQTVSIFAKLLPKPVINMLYRSDILSWTVRKSLNFIAPEGMTTVTIASGGLEGMRMALDLNSEKDYWLGTYELGVQNALKDFVSEGMVAYDVGANIGYFSLLFTRLVGESGHIYAFEALEDNIQRIHSNLALNDLSTRVHVIPAAVIDTEKTTRLMRGPSNGMGKVEGAAGRENITYGEGMEVDGLSLDRFVYVHGKPAPQVIKIDIEGGELLALPGMKQLMKDVKPLLFLELHGQQATVESWNILSQFGYQLHRIEKDYPKIATSEDLDWKSYIIAN